MAVTIGISPAIEIAIYLASDIAVDMAIYIAVEIASDLMIVFAIENASDLAIDIAFNMAIDMAFDMIPLDFCGLIFLIEVGSGRGMDKLDQIGAAGRNLLSEDEARSLHPGYHLRAPTAVDA